MIGPNTHHYRSCIRWSWHTRVLVVVCAWFVLTVGVVPTFGNGTHTTFHIGTGATPPAPTSMCVTTKPPMTAPGGKIIQHP